MNAKFTYATPILLINIVLLMFFNGNLHRFESTSSSSVCCCVSSSSSSESSVTSSSSISSSSSVQPNDEQFRQNHNNILTKDLDDVTLDDEEDILDALEDYDQLDQADKDKLADEKEHLDALLDKITRLKSQDKINQKKTTILDAEGNGHFHNIPVCENDFIPELTLRIEDLLNDDTVTVNVSLINDPKYEVEIIDDETLEAIAFELTATFTPCPGFQDRRDAQNTKAEIEQLLAEGYFLNLIVPNLNTTNMKAAVLARVADLALEYGTTITIINDTRSGSTYTFTFVIAKGDYEVSFNATATFTVG